MIGINLNISYDDVSVQDAFFILKNGNGYCDGDARCLVLKV